MGRRITRKQLKQDDEFVSAAEWIFRWVADNVKAIVAGIVAVCVIALIWWGVSSWLGARTGDASILLSQAVKTFEGEITPGSPILVGDVDAAQAEFLQVVESYGRSDQADMARLYLARIDLGRGNTEEARSALVDLKDRRGDDMVGSLATLDLIDLRVASGQGAEVAGELDAMVLGQNKALPPDAALFKLGEIFVTEGDSEKARLYFERLVEEFPESPYLAGARQKLTELG